VSASDAPAGMAPVTPRVLFLAHSGVLAGGERSLLDLAAAWSVEREVMVLAEGPFPQALAARGVPLTVAPLRALGTVKRESATPGLGAVADVARLATVVARRARAFDVIHANSQKSFVVAAAAGLLARRPVTWHLRDILTTQHFSTTNIRAAVMLANARAAAVIANSEATAAAFIEAGGRAALVRVVHNGIAAAPFDAVSATERNTLRATLAPGAQLVLASVGRLAAWKGQHVLIAATEAIPGAMSWIVGSALFGEDRYATGLEEQVRALGIAGKVRLLGDRVDVPALLAAADLVIHSAVAPEPFGRVIVEGMLARRPVIASDAGGAREIITHGETGFLVEPGDPAALAALVQLVRAMPPAQRDALVRRARAMAESRFSVAAMVSGVERVLAGVVSARRRRT
jgi:glycosyltransferase involved in cell wall biosynthesis